MEFGATTSTLTKKHSNSHSVTGRSDYNEVFGCSDASSSIPILELPELKERRMVEDFQRSNLDYSKVFSGFDNLDTAVPFEELIPKPKASKR
jgi:hypothetical protein